MPGECATSAPHAQDIEVVLNNHDASSIHLVAMGQISTHTVVAALENPRQVEADPHFPLQDVLVILPLPNRSNNGIDLV